MSKVANIDATETHDDTNSVKMHSGGTVTSPSEVTLASECEAVVMSKHISGIRNVVDKRLITKRFPTNLKMYKNVRRYDTSK